MSVLILYFRITAILPILVTQQFIPLKGKLALMKLLQRTSKIVMNTQTFFAKKYIQRLSANFFSAICQIRLDFETFKIAQVTTTTGTCDSDTVSFTSPAGRVHNFWIFFFRQMDFETFFSYCRILHHFVEP